MNNISFVETIKTAIQYDKNALNALMQLDRSLVPEFDAELLSVTQALDGFLNCLHPYENATDGARAFALIRYVDQRQKFVTCYYKSIALHTGAKVLSNYKDKL
ncbi:hypothetical protein [Vibrio cholerae]|uniref:hypothetical protein n=1 Tax=Vibrio cholerae TaxID=666 RepID=UPI002FE62139